jgi:hypothetical protein
MRVDRPSIHVNLEGTQAKARPHGLCQTELRNAIMYINTSFSPQTDKTGSQHISYIPILLLQTGNTGSQIHSHPTSHTPILAQRLEPCDSRLIQVRSPFRLLLPVACQRGTLPQCSCIRLHVEWLHVQRLTRSVRTQRHVGLEALQVPCAGSPLMHRHLNT